MDLGTEPVCANNSDVVESVLAMLRDQIGPQKFNAWFRHGAQLAIHGDALQVAVPNPFVANWIESHYQDQIGQIVRQVIGRSVSVAVTIDATLSEQLRRSDRDSQAELVTKSTEGRARRWQPVGGGPLKHTLEDFVVGQTNRLA